MTVTHTQTGWLAAGISAGVIAILCVMLVLWGPNLPFTFSHRNPPCTDLEKQVSNSESELVVDVLSNRNSFISTATHRSALSAQSIASEYTQHGALYVLPDKQSTVMAFDIMMRMLMVTGLLAKATAVVPVSRLISQVSTLSNGTYATPSTMNSNTAPHLSVNFGSHIDLYTSVFSAADSIPVLAGAEFQISKAALCEERRAIDNMRVATAMLWECHSPPSPPRFIPFSASQLLPPAPSEICYIFPQPQPIKIHFEDPTPLSPLLEQLPMPPTHIPSIRVSPPRSPIRTQQQNTPEYLRGTSEATKRASTRAKALLCCHSEGAEEVIEDSDATFGSG